VPENPLSDIGAAELTIVTDILNLFRDLDSDGRRRVLQTVATFYGIPVGTPSRPETVSFDRNAPSQSGHYGGGGSFSENRSIAPKQFIFEKQPKTDVERVACLAYYLTHYRDTPHFKTIDISKLNTESAQVKFSNAAVAVENATRQNYLVSATRGNKQLSAVGEQFVHALPDRDRAKAIMAKSRPKRRTRRAGESNGEPGENE
jgi:hypothetical protein